MIDVDWIPPEVIDCGRYIDSAGYMVADIASASRQAPAAAAFPAANRALYVPFVLRGAFTVRSVFWSNGGTVNGNTDCGIYTKDGARIYSTGATLQAGTTTLQIITLGTPVVLSAGSYHMALASSSATATYRSWPDVVLALQRAGIRQEALGVLPATMAPATVASPYLPLFGIASITTY